MRYISDTIDIKDTNTFQLSYQWKNTTWTKEKSTLFWVMVQGVAKFYYSRPFAENYLSLLDFSLSLEE